MKVIENNKELYHLMMNAEQDLRVHNGCIFDIEGNPIACMVRTLKRNKDVVCARVIERVEKLSGVRFSAFRNRKAEHVACKQVTIKILRDQYGYTMMQIGDVLGLNHATVSYNLSVVNKRLGHPSFKYLTNLYHLCNGPDET